MKKPLFTHLTWIRTLATACMLLMLYGCFDDGALREQMRDFEERLADLEGTVIADLNDQISGVKASVEALAKVDTELQTYVDELDDAITALEKRIKEVEASLEEPEPEQGADPNAEAIKALEAELAALEAALEDLVAMDSLLDAKVEELRGFVTDELKADKEWTESTFATLEQYGAVETEIASVKESLKDLEAGLAELADALAGLGETHREDIDGLKDVTRQLYEEIAAAEEGMKTWVNEKLAESYYDIAAVDAKLAELKKEYADADEALRSQVSAQQDSLVQAKKELTAVYEKAIADAIEKNNGVLDSKIADVVKTAQEALQVELNSFHAFITSMEARLSALESDFVNRIQSLIYIPEYSDGKVVVYQNDPSFALEFLITPVKLAAELQNLWATDHSIFQAGLCYVKDPETRASSNIVPLDVVSVEGSSAGVLRLVVAENKDVPLKDDFWKGVVPAVAYIHITDGKNDFASEMIVLQGRLGGGIDFEEATDLSKYQPGSSSGASSATANCYLVSKSGQFKFPALKGNSSESVGDVASATVLWESFGTSEAPSTGDLIRSVGCRNGLIGFETAADFRKGNAVIAAKDAAGKILWSWHIWFTDQPDEQVYYNGAGTMMDRNLGATCATPDDVGALGLLYQWGRKDPFLGSASVSETVIAGSTMTWPSAVTSDNSNGTIEFTIANPTTFVLGNPNNYDWYYTGDSMTDDTRWTGTDSRKSIYDPCPAGWRIPDEEVWTVACGTATHYDGNGTGVNFSGVFGDDQTIWYPASGSMRFNQGTISSVGSYGMYTSCSVNEGYARYMSFYMAEEDISIVRNYRSWGLPARCFKEGSASAGGSGDESGEGSEGKVNMDSANDLSPETGGMYSTANCYIVSEAGTYKFKAYKGNSRELPGASFSGEIAGVELLWETFGTTESPEVGDLIEVVDYKDTFVGFKTADNFREGNAVIAAKDAAGKILWSWHIWFTDQPDEQVYYNGAGTMMDRNLGATCATPGDVGALGLLYQWGRKDPFLGFSSITSPIVAASTLEWPSPVESDVEKGTLDYSVANPMSYIYGSADQDWLIEPDSLRWQSQKTIYDPCPAGWRVPDGGLKGVWMTASGSGDFLEMSYNETSRGIDFSGMFSDASHVWYPSAGCRNSSDDGEPFNKWGYCGYYLSCSHVDSKAYGIYHSETGYVNLLSLYECAYGGSVRCFKEGSSQIIPTPDPEPEVEFEIEMKLADENIAESGLQQEHSVDMLVSYKTSDGAAYIPKNTSWRSSDESVATVDANGKVTAVIEHIEKSGYSNGVPVKITHVADNKECTIEIMIVKVLPTRIEMTAVPSVDGALYTMIHRDSFTFEAKVYPEKACQDVWYAGGGYLQIPNNTFPAMTVGDVNFIAYAADDTDVRLYFTVKVLPIAITDMSLSMASLEIMTGAKAALSVNYSPSDASFTTFRWSSSNETVAVVNEGGIVTAVGPGKAVITVEQEENGISRTCDVTVTDVETAYKVGDFYYSTGMVSSSPDEPKSTYGDVIGVIFSIDNPTMGGDDKLSADHSECVNGYVVSTMEYTDQDFGSVSNLNGHSYYAGLGLDAHSIVNTDKANGYGNTLAHAALNASKSDYCALFNREAGVTATHSAAVAVPESATAWYVPSYREMQMLVENSEVVNNSLVSVGGTAVAGPESDDSSSSDWYWTSTIYGSWYNRGQSYDHLKYPFDVSRNGWTAFQQASAKCRVRMILAF